MAADGPVTSQIRLLVEIDGLDRAIVRCLDQREQIRAAHRTAREVIEGVLSQISDLDKEMAVAAKDQAHNEAELKWRVEKIRKVADFSHVSSQKEAEAAEKEFQALQASRTSLEEQILGLMERGEELAGRRRALLTEGDARKRSLSERVGEWKGRLGVLSGEVDRARADRTPLLETMASDLRSVYEHAFARYGDRGVCTVKAGRCPHCQVAVPPQHVVNILLGKAFHTCQHCLRLILPEEGLSG